MWWCLALIFALLETILVMWIASPLWIANWLFFWHGLISSIPNVIFSKSNNDYIEQTFAAYYTASQLQNFCRILILETCVVLLNRIALSRKGFLKMFLEAPHLLKQMLDRWGWRCIDNELKNGKLHRRGTLASLPLHSLWKVSELFGFRWSCAWTGYGAKARAFYLWNTPLKYSS